MQTISKEYAEQNAQLHKERPDYGAGGGSKWASLVSDVCTSIQSIDVLDYGAGKGSLARCLPSAKVTSYDPAVEEFSATPEPHEVVACLDVLEHVEPEFLDAVLTDLAVLTKKACVLVIATGPAKKTLSDGRNAHLIQKDAAWWFRELSEYFEVNQFNNAGYNIIFIVKPITWPRGLQS